MPTVPKRRKPSWINGGRHQTMDEINAPRVITQRVQKINGVDIYKTNRHRNASLACRAANPLCQFCLDEGRSTVATLMDHVIPINRGGAIWDTRNHRSSCDLCHNEKRSRESRGIIMPHMTNDEGDLIPYTE